MSDLTLNRREFLAAGGAGAATLAWPRRAARAADQRPNILFILCDQLSLDALACHGCQWVQTPNLDRLAASGVSFIESHSPNPVCSPARSALLTGRMPVETGVITNNRQINQAVPNLGQWFSEQGYRTFYCGKWHLHQGYAPPGLPGFTVLPSGAAQGDLSDPVISQNVAAFIRHQRAGDDPYLMVASFMQPHDICYWAIQHQRLVPETLHFPELGDELPELPPNHASRPPAPRKLDALAFKQFVNDEQWRYYLYSYYRMVEMLDADVGRLLDAVEDSGQAEQTLICFTSDHGEGGGRHRHVQKWYPYEESVKVPLIFACPDRIGAGRQDTRHLVSGIDLPATFADFAGCPAPPTSWARSLRPLLEERPVEWREFLVTEHHVTGRMVRTPEWKFVHYTGDPVEQLFHLPSDPWEMTNRYQEPASADLLSDHRRLLTAWNQRLSEVEPSPDLTPRPKPAR